MKATPQAIHTDAVFKAANNQERNTVLDDRPPQINNTEVGLTRKQSETLAQLTTEYSWVPLIV